jgi:copper chaperone CopZ
MQTHFRITNLSCEACVKLSKSVLRDIPGIEAIDINLQIGDSFVEAPEPIAFEKIQNALQEVGKEVTKISK